MMGEGGWEAGGNGERERQDNSDCSAVDALGASATSKPFGSLSVALIEPESGS